MFVWCAKQEVGRRPRLEGTSRAFLHDLILCGLDELDLLAGLPLEGGDGLADRRVLPGVEPPFPPDHQVGGSRARRREASSARRAETGTEVACMPSTPRGSA